MPVNTSEEYNVPLNQPTNFEVSQNASQNISVPVILQKYHGDLSYKTTTFIPRINNPDPSPNPINTAGIPGANYVGSDQGVPIFWQGEDVIFDTFLYINNQPIDVKRYNLYTVVKATQYSLIDIWKGSLGDGIYIDDSIPNHFVIFIPSCDTNCLIAGSFELDVWAVERVSQLNNIKPRTLLVGRTFFDFEYAAFSPDPESLQSGSNNRARLRSSYPSFVSTVAGASTEFDNIPILG